MRALKIVSILLMLMVLSSVAFATVAASDYNSETQKGNLTVSGNSHKVVVKMQSTNATTQNPLILVFYVNETKETSVGAFKVLLLDEDNFNKYEAGTAYTTKAESISFNLDGAKAFGLVSITDTKLYYLVVDNQAHSETLKVDYEIGVSNGDLIPIEEILWTIWIIVIVILIILVIIVLYLVSKKKASPPLPPPMPPQPPQPPAQ